MLDLRCNSARIDHHFAGIFYARKMLHISVRIIKLFSIRAAYIFRTEPEPALELMHNVCMCMFIKYIYMYVYVCCIII